MTGRWRRLRQNAGTGGAVKTMLVLAAFGVIAIGVAVTEGEPRVGAGYGIGLLAPWLLRARLVAELERTVQLLRLSGMLIFAAAFAGGLLRGRLWPEGSPLEMWLLTGLTTFVGIYVSAFFWTLSDPEVVRLDEPGSS